MNRIALVVSDVDGTLVTHDKRLTDGARRAVRRLHDCGVGFTITSSRPPGGMRFLIEPLGITLPIGPFNGSSIVDSQLNPIEQHLIPDAAVRRSIEVLDEFGVDVWLFTSERWIVRRDDGRYVPHERDTIKFDPTFANDFAPFMATACKIVGASADATLLQRCETAMQKALGTQASAIRSQSYYLDITPPGRDKGTFVETIAGRLNISTDAIATIGDMQNDLAMFKKSGLSIAMGNATEDVKQQSSHVTRSNEEEGFAGAIEFILKQTPTSS
ncbi:HAD family hydrolase [uncultured Bradyrhizobium sp.]|uniref:HAD family hydrolase n=1 Tax=uncultured Bradyrhizobium sp. TaxID=199684 RepID=UPI0035CAA6BC